MPDNNSSTQEDKIVLANKSNPDRWKKDTRFITKSKIEKNNLFLTITYSGGCKEHTFELVAWNYFIVKPNGIDAHILLSHDSRSDSCKALIKKELCFDLSPLNSEYYNLFQSTSGTIVLLLDNLKLRYKF